MPRQAKHTRGAARVSIDQRRLAERFLLEVPFGEASTILVEGWWHAITEFVKARPIEWQSSQHAARVTRQFAELGKLATNFDPHLAEGLRHSARGRPANHAAELDVDRPQSAAGGPFTRPYLLLLQHMMNEEIRPHITIPPHSRQFDRRNPPKQYLFSPLFFLRQMLTAPEFPASEALAHVAVRAEIFAAAVQYNTERARMNPAGYIDTVREIISFSRVAASVQKADSYRRKGDTFYPDDATDLVVGHMLASRGLAVLTLAPHSRIYEKKRGERPLIGRDLFLEERKLVPDKGIYEFRIVNAVSRLPSAAELLNEIDGLPFALPGAEVVFARGLRLSTDSGVVGRISGSSGAGKTSLALAMGTALAPLGITTFYISCEEEPPDLKKRVVTLTPEFISRTRTFKHDIDEWFFPEHLDSPDPTVNRINLFEIVDKLVAAYRSEGVSIVTNAPPGLTPLLVVLDGVHELLGHPADPSLSESVQLRQIIDKLREVGACVLVLTAETHGSILRELDYLVDFVVELSLENKFDVSLEMRRKFLLSKTRLQHSMSGSHYLHISARDGVKIFPQLAAQQQHLGYLKWAEIDKDSFYDILQSGFERGARGEQHLPPLVKLFWRSQILITGRGSSGKAGFALKILLKPLKSPTVDRNADFQDLLISLESRRGVMAEQRRILILSFLYPPSYYAELAERLKPTIDRDSSQQHARLDYTIDCLSFYPGHLSAETLLSKFLHQLQQATLEGSPYHGVMIDGLHNVFLQYPSLQDEPMLWPVIYEICRVSGLTLITTHTQFLVKGMEDSIQLRSDVEAATRRVGPLLQALLHSADFYLDVSPETGSQSTPARIDVLNAYDQETRASHYYWNRDPGIIEILRTFKQD